MSRFPCMLQALPMSYMFYNVVELNTSQVVLIKKRISSGSPAVAQSYARWHRFHQLLGHGSPNYGPRAGFGPPVHFHPMSRGSSVSIVSGCGLDDRAIEVRSPAGSEDIFSSQTGSGAHPVSCTMGTGSTFPGGKSAAGAWRWPLTPI
jgi:hypothetical protein